MDNYIVNSGQKELKSRQLRRKLVGKMDYRFKLTPPSFGFHSNVKMIFVNDWTFLPIQHIYYSILQFRSPLPQTSLNFFVRNYEFPFTYTFIDVGH